MQRERELNAKSPGQVQQLLVQSPKAGIWRDAGARQQRNVYKATAQAVEFVPACFVRMNENKNFNI